MTATVCAMPTYTVHEEIFVLLSSNKYATVIILFIDKLICMYTQVSTMT